MVWTKKIERESSGIGSKGTHNDTHIRTLDVSKILLVTVGESIYNLTFVSYTTSSHHI